MLSRNLLLSRLGEWVKRERERETDSSTIPMHPEYTCNCENCIKHNIRSPDMTIELDFI